MEVILYEMAPKCVKLVEMLTTLPWKINNKKSFNKIVLSFCIWIYILGFQFKFTVIVSCVTNYTLLMNS